jgi:hypothetical protein
LIRKVTPDREGVEFNAVAEPTDLADKVLQFFAEQVTSFVAVRIQARL